MYNNKKIYKINKIVLTISNNYYLATSFCLPDCLQRKQKKKGGLNTSLQEREYLFYLENLLGITLKYNIKFSNWIKMK